MKKEVKKHVSKVEAKIEEKEAKKHVPLGIKIISVYQYIKAAFYILGGIALIVFYFTWDKLLASLPPEQLAQLPKELVSVQPSLFMTMGIGNALLGIIFIIISIYLWKMKNWSRLFHLILYAVFIVVGIASLVKSIQIPDIGSVIWQLVMIIVNGTIIWYLGFNKKITFLFKK